MSLPGTDSGTVLAALNKVSVCYGSRTVLHDVSLEVRRGQFWTIIGPNGAGKSTLLGLFNGLTLPSAGEVRFKGELVTPASAPRVRLDIAHVFQATDLDPRMPLSVFEAVLSGSYGRLGLWRWPGKAEKERAMASLEAVGLAHLARRPIGQLSGGERQRVALARALTQEPQLILLDEPTAALDWQAQREILNTMAALRQSLDIAVIMVTHDLNAAFALTDKTAMLQAGRILWQGMTGDAMEEDLLSHLYSVPITIAGEGRRKAALF